MNLSQKIITSTSGTLLIGLLVHSLVINSCKKFEAEHELIVHTDTISVIGPNFIEVDGVLVDFRGNEVQDYGFVISSEGTPGTDDSNKTSLGPKKSTGPFSHRCNSGIRSSTSYNVWAFAMDGQGIEYGRMLTFTTPGPVIPQLTTTVISSASDSSAQTGGTGIDDGGADITKKGVCWSVDPNPTVEGKHTDEGGGSDNFTSLLDSLICGTTYYVKAYATNVAGTGYGEELSFTTVACAIDKPTVTTDPVSEVTDSSALSGGNVLDDGGAEVTARGVCWSTTSQPTPSHTYTTDGTGTGKFSSEITGLEPTTTYFVRAYAINSEGIGYGDEIEFNTLAPENIVTDYDGNTYTIAKIGFQTWMTENLKVKHYADGTPIPYIEEQSEWGNMGPTNKAYCFYSNDTSYKNVYGALYTWAATMNGAASSHLNPSGVQGVCPTGWHVPSDVEWKQLEMHLGMTQTEADSKNWRSTDVGGKMKETGTAHWKSPNTGATNESKFSARPGGSRNSTGAFLNHRLDCYFWSSTDGGGSLPWYRYLGYEHMDIYRSDYQFYGEGYSVRCVRDDVAATTPAVTTAAITSTTETSAQSGGEVTSDGGSAVTARGICWSTDGNPTLADDRATDGSGTGTFSSSLIGLECNTTYYVRAYATNSLGTAYGPQIQFTTSACVIDKPEVTTAMISQVTGVSAQSGGEVTDEGGAAVTKRGVCWGTSQEPTIDDNPHTEDGSGPGSFTSTLTELEMGTRYYVRAYATNSAGTNYGNQTSFYTKDLALVITFEITNVTEVSAQGGGNVTDGGGAAVTARGVCWSRSPDPTVSDSCTSDGTGLGIFTSQLTGLPPSETFYVRAYAVNIAGIAYGDNVTFTTHESVTTVTDYDGNEYYTVQIGTQTWMAENLKTKHYADGTLIPYVPLDTLWEYAGRDGKAYCYYDNDPMNDTLYGTLYNYAAAMNGAASSDAIPSGVQGVCPNGWHLPSDAEWKLLETGLGMTQLEADGTLWRGSNEGGKMKTAGSIWTSPNVGATNESGFGAIPGGWRHDWGLYSHFGTYAVFWSTTAYSSIEAWHRNLENTYEQVYRNYYDKRGGFSIRCIKD